MVLSDKSPYKNTGNMVMIRGVAEINHFVADPDPTSEKPDADTDLGSGKFLYSLKSSTLNRKFSFGKYFGKFVNFGIIVFPCFFSSVADPGCLSRIRIRPFFCIPDPDPTVFYPESRIRVLQIRKG
jgi:hypothetical protein